MTLCEMCEKNPATATLRQGYAWWAVCQSCGVDLLNLTLRGVSER